MGTQRTRHSQRAKDRADALTEEFVRVGLVAANHYASRLARSLGLPASDIADLRQDLLLDLVRRAGLFDGRAGLATFADQVSRHASHDLADRVIRDRRRHGGSLDDLIRVGDALLPRHAVLAEADGLGAWWTGAPDPFAVIEQRLDVERFLAGLPDRLRRLCHLLVREEVPDAQRLSGLSRSRFFRDIADLRMRLTAIGGTPRD
mgnify:CR=1 FL=1